MSPARPDPAWLATAIEIVRRAGEIQLAGQAEGFHVDKKGARDLVTEVDVACERMGLEVLAERFPTHGILAEEAGGSCEDGGSHRWVFDPLDGTTNYAHHVPAFCASLALEVDGEAVVAAVFDPTHDELYTAARGEGAWMNGRPLRVSTVKRLIDALLVTGFPYDLQRDPVELLQVFGAMLKSAQAVRRFGAAALDLCHVAAGRYEGFWERRLWPWDVAAGTLIVREAGGQVTNMDGDPFDPGAGQLLATNGLVHEAMLKVIAVAGCAPDRTAVTA